jgi:monothiol glutaredoxin
MDTHTKIKEQLQNNPILIYMKGTPENPQCGFSARSVAALKTCGEPFGYINVLENPDIRQELPKYANWPTFPQLYVNGELIGGCDIILELYQNGELQTLIKETVKNKL